jgi:hypothetical protein
LKAQQSLKRFFDFRQLTIADRGLHQHALLNLVNLHYEDGAYLLARNALNEAVRLARQVGDRECLNACFGLSKRLDYVDPHGKAQTQGFWSEDFSTQLSIDEFWQIREGLRNVRSRFESCTRRLMAMQGEPTTHVFHHLYRSKALLMPDTIGYKFDKFKLRWEATSTELWSLLGVLGIRKDEMRAEL